LEEGAKAPTASFGYNGNIGEEIDNSTEEFMVTTERDFKRCTQWPKDHFEKILEAVYPHDP
jgi:hypothetical protein